MELTNKEVYDKYLDMKANELSKEQLKRAFDKAKAKTADHIKQPKKEFVK